MGDAELLAFLSAEDGEAFLALSEEDKVAVREAFTRRLPPSEQLRALTDQLFARARARDGRVLRRQPFGDAKIHDCFNNALAWVKAHEGHALLRGYLFNPLGWSFPHVRFTPHVAVRTETGDWIDVTPHGAVDDYLFLQHAGTDEEFDAAFKHGPMDFICPR